MSEFIMLKLAEINSELFHIKLLLTIIVGEIAGFTVLLAVLFRNI